MSSDTRNTYKTVSAAVGVIIGIRHTYSDQSCEIQLNPDIAKSVKSAIYFVIPRVP